MCVESLQHFLYLFQKESYTKTTTNKHTHIQPEFALLPWQVAGVGPLCLKQASIREQVKNLMKE